MSDTFDDLTKALARGESRRTTLKRFATGVTGALLATVLAGRAAEAELEESGSVWWYRAEAPRECQEACRDAEVYLGNRHGGREFGKCVSKCAKCLAHGYHHVQVNEQVVCV